MQQQLCKHSGSVFNLEGIITVSYVRKFDYKGMLLDMSFYNHYKTQDNLCLPEV